MAAVSIIVPVYNAEAYLERCIDSILSQSCPDIEVLLIDDGSTDESASICDEYVVKDGRFRVIHKGNEGVSAVRNFAIHQVTGDYIWFIDSDDYLARSAIDRVLDLIQQERGLSFPKAVDAAAQELNLSECLFKVV